MLGVFSCAALVEADSGFPDRNNTAWAEYTRHTITDRHVPERSRTLRAIVHAEDKHATRVTAGRGRFLMREQEDLLAITVHLPFVNNQDEQEIIRNQTLAEISSAIRRHKKGRPVVVQGDFSCQLISVTQSTCQTENRDSAARGSNFWLWPSPAISTLYCPRHALHRIPATKKLCSRQSPS